MTIMKDNFPHPKKPFLEERKHRGEDMQQPHLPELKRFLEENWQQIDEIYISLQKQAGANNPIHIPHKIKTDLSLEYGTGAAMIPTDRTTVYFRHKGLPSDNHDLPRLIHYWVHEAVHATSKAKEKISLFPKTSYTMESGVAMRSLTLNPDRDDKHVNDLGEDFNEAITEHIANTILVELSRRGIYKQSDENIRKEAAYKPQGESFTEIVSALAKHFEVDEELLWRSFVRQYFTAEIPIRDFYSMLFQLTKDKELKFVHEKLVSLIDKTKASKIIKVGEESKTFYDVKDALDWSKRGLRLDQ